MWAFAAVDVAENQKPSQSRPADAENPAEDGTGDHSD
jgi:hypothetical protein